MKGCGEGNDFDLVACFQLGKSRDAEIGPLDTRKIMEVLAAHGLREARDQVGDGKRRNLTIADLARLKNVTEQSLKRLGALEMSGGVGFPMRNAQGELTGYRMRFPDGGQKTFGPTEGTKGRNAMLYPDDLDRAKPIILCEGETDCAKALDMGLNAMASPGAGQIKSADAPWFRGASVIIVPDLDKPGQRGARRIANMLVGLAAQVRIVRLLGEVKEDSGQDLRDFFNGGGTLDLFNKLVEQAELVQVDEGKTTPTQLLLNIAEAFDYFHDQNFKAHARIAHNGHFENLPLRSSAFRELLTGRFYREHNITPRRQDIDDVLGRLSGLARWESPEEKTFVRMAESEGKFYIDLGSPSWEAVEISASGWSIVQNPPVKFVRPRFFGAMPVPQRGQGLDLLQNFVNFATNRDWVLYIGWLLAAFNPEGPYPVLVINGEQGSAKSCLAEISKQLVDPASSRENRKTPKNSQELAIAAYNCWCLSIDNLSYMPKEMSDDFCQISTGGTFSSRELYSDSEEIQLHICRPVILNGIEEMVTRGDLLDRSIIVTLPVIDRTKRKSLKRFRKEFKLAWPYIFGALLDVVVQRLAVGDIAEPDGLPRMADFALWVLGAEDALGWPKGAFFQSYTGNISESADIALESSAIGMAIYGYLEKWGTWTGTFGDFLSALNGEANERTKQSRGWPANGKGLSNSLRRLAPALRIAGFSVQPGPKTKHGCVVTICKEANSMFTMFTNETEISQSVVSQWLTSPMRVNIAG
jgi:hypothetical protein